jgi:hypothetical protein
MIEFQYTSNRSLPQSAHLPKNYSRPIPHTKKIDLGWGTDARRAPKRFDAKNQGHSEASDIRKIMYCNVFAGAAGQTYGCHAVWQMYDLDKTPVNAPLKPLA